MFNPFVPFHIKMIEELRKMRRRYFVTQTNKAELDVINDDPKIPLLICDYENLGLAKIHFNAIVTSDKFRAIIDIEKDEHRAKLKEMLGADSKYKVYSSFIQDVKTVEKRLNDKYSKNIRNYITRMTNWRIGADKTISPNLELIFGELFVTLKYGSQSVRIKLAELEKY
ncbi:MAG: hypothetical protein ABIR18_09875 [Chitinophagaceae bacterium]